MKIDSIMTGTVLTLALEGRLDTTTAPELELALDKELTDSVDTLILELEKLVYLSSAGLRVILGAQKKMNAAGGKLVVRHVCETIMEVFEVTGFTDILTIE